MDLLLANVLGYCNPAPKLRQASHNFLHLAVRSFGAIAAEHNTVRTRCSAQWLKSESVAQLQDLRSDGVTIPRVVAVQVLIVFHNIPYLICCIFHTHILCLVSINNNCVQTQLRVSDVLKDSCTLTTKTFSALTSAEEGSTVVVKLKLSLSNNFMFYAVSGKRI